MALSQVSRRSLRWETLDGRPMTKWDEMISMTVFIIAVISDCCISWIGSVVLAPGCK